MARPKGEPREKIGTSVRLDLYIKFKRISDETGIPISKLLDQAVELFVDEYDNKNK